MFATFRVVAGRLPQPDNRDEPQHMRYVKNIFLFFKKWAPKPIEAEQLLQHSKVFCMAPWVHLHALPDGKVYTCGMAATHTNHSIGDVHKNKDLSKAWNSYAMKRIRRNMLTGQASASCKNCYEYEQLCNSSERLQFNQDFKHHVGRVLSTSFWGGLSETSILHLDIRFSNQCNLKCRICNASASSAWREEAIQMGYIQDHFPNVVRATNDEASFWKLYVKLLPHIEKIHFAGGEPLLMEEHYKTLEHLIAIGKTDTHISYNTNFSTLRFRQWASVEQGGAKHTHTSGRSPGHLLWYRYNGKHF
ncbi:MAG: twitch domain-containing radical SAM protein [Saprospiraceae bacterium]|nr:twitch domain-containing radical SAM protein [Saprospiraceae bacterium]